MRRAFTLATTAAASLIRAGHGTQVQKGVEGFKRPSKILTLYLKESCPFSRKVREGFSELDLDVNIRPCPKKGERFRPELVPRGGQEQVPLLLDPNHGSVMYESENILKHVFNNYGPGEKHIPYLLGPAKLATRNSQLATIARMVRGNLSINWTKDSDTAPLEAKTLDEKTAANTIDGRTKSGQAPTDPKSGSAPTEAKSGNTQAENKSGGSGSGGSGGAPASRGKVLRLYSYEGSGNCRIVRETLDALEIPYYIHNIAKGSLKREDFKKMTGGKVQFPYIIDENTGKEMFESEEICKYLYQTYSPREQKK